MGIIFISGKKNCTPTTLAKIQRESVVVIRSTFSNEVSISSAIIIEHPLDMDCGDRGRQGAGEMKCFILKHTVLKLAGGNEYGNLVGKLRFVVSNDYAGG